MISQTEALRHGKYLLDAGNGTNSRLSFEEQVIVALMEIIGVDKEQHG